MYNNDIKNGNLKGYRPNNLATMSTVNDNFNNLISREQNQLNLLELYLEIE